MSEKLKREFIELLEKDLDFRYSVAGYLGFSEILKRLNRIGEGQNKLWEEVKKLWIEVKTIREDQRKLRVLFESFGRALGVTLEDYTASAVKLMLEDMGYPGAEVGKKTLLFNNEIYEINIFCDDPLTVGEVTLYIRDVDEARRELEKLLRRIEIAEKKENKKAVLKVLAVANASKEVLDHLKTMAEQRDIRLLYGREL